MMMTKLFILSLVTVLIAIYLQARIAARRIRNQRNVAQGLSQRRLVLRRRTPATEPRNAGVPHRAQMP